MVTICRSLKHEEELVVEGLEADLMLQKTFSYLINELKTSKILFISN